MASVGSTLSAAGISEKPRRVLVVSDDDHHDDGDDDDDEEEHDEVPRVPSR
eukprot:gene45199-24442_t